MLQTVWLHITYIFKLYNYIIEVDFVCTLYSTWYTNKMTWSSVNKKSLHVFIINRRIIYTCPVFLVLKVRLKCQWHWQIYSWHIQLCSINGLQRSITADISDFCIRNENVLRRYNLCQPRDFRMSNREQ